MWNSPQQNGQIPLRYKEMDVETRWDHMIDGHNVGTGLSVIRGARAGVGTNSHVYIVADLSIISSTYRGQHNAEKHWH